jgi:hypothetical protein
MSAHQSLTNRIVPASVDLALKSVRRPERVLKFMHAAARRRAKTGTGNAQGTIRKGV